MGIVSPMMMSSSPRLIPRVKIGMIVHVVVTPSSSQSSVLTPTSPALHTHRMHPPVLLTIIPTHGHTSVTALHVKSPHGYASPASHHSILLLLRLTSLLHIKWMISSIRIAHLMMPVGRHLTPSSSMLRRLLLGGMPLHLIVRGS